LACLDVVGADVLRDAARLSGRDLRAPDVVEQRGLAVVDVAHDRDHGGRGCCSRPVRLDFANLVFDLVFLAAASPVAHLLDYDRRGGLVDDLVDGTIAPRS
jgi:hypothetical protein